MTDLSKVRVRVSERRVPGEGGSYRAFQILADRIVEQSQFVADIRPIEDDGEAVARRMVVSWNSRDELLEALREDAFFLRRTIAQLRSTGVPMENLNAFRQRADELDRLIDEQTKGVAEGANET